MTDPKARMLPHFVMTTFGAAALLTLGAVLGGIWPLLALTYMTGMAYALDQKIIRAPKSDVAGVEAADANALSVILALIHFALLLLAVWALSAATLGGWATVFLFFANGLFFGQVSNSNAHELIHRTDATLRRLGTWVYISLLFGHHATAHVRVHHRFAATPDDPNTAPWGMSYYRFAIRAWVGSFRAGLREENAFRARGKASDLHPYILYFIGGIGCLSLSVIIGGVGGALAYVLLSSFATSQLLISDYVQHYGLERSEISDGKYEPMGNAHSWNAPQWFTSNLMLNAPRHSDHHANPMRPYPSLELTDDMPQLPRSLPAMAFLALFPKYWKQVMDPRVANQRAAQFEAAETSAL